MGRPKDTKNNMRTPKEKEKIIKEYVESNKGYMNVIKKYNISESTFRLWLNNYREKGIQGLISKTGRHTKKDCLKGRMKKATTEEERLIQIIMKQEIEISRLKKGYVVRGVGQEKEFVTTFKKNMK